jgi:hypothetical protein
MSGLSSRTGPFQAHKVKYPRHKIHAVAAGLQEDGPDLFGSYTVKGGAEAGFVWA